MMNERTFSWHLPKDAVEKLVSLDKKDRREYFSNLPIDNVPIGSLMDFSNISVDDKGQVSFYIVPQEFHYNPLGTVHGGLAATILDSWDCTRWISSNNLRFLQQYFSKLSTR